METKPSKSKVIYWDCTESSTKVGPESVIISRHDHECTEQHGQLFESVHYAV